MTRARNFANLANNTTNLEILDTLYGNNVLTGRNLIINGAMTVAQRGTVTGSTGSYGGPDRFLFARSGALIADISQATDVPSGQGFANSYKFDVTTADSSLAAGDYAILIQKIEGQNLQHLKKGTSSAESVTLSFWIKSSTTGTYILELYDDDNARQISKSYTVDTADTWEKKTITFAGDTSGAFDNDNASSLQIVWWLAAGSTFSGGTLNTSWASNTNANRAVGQVNAIDDAVNNIFITGVQLEVGDTATPFEHRSFAQELTLCERYYRQSGAYGSVPSGIGGFVAVQGMNTTSGQKALTKDWSTPMRATPTITVLDSSGTVGRWNAINTAGSWTNNLTYTGIADQNAGGFKVYVNSSGGYGYGMHYRADAEL